jgi:plasmid maintenance system antidote protein VapI
VALDLRTLVGVSGVSPYTVRRIADNGRMSPAHLTTTKPLSAELPRILNARGITLRSLAAAVGGIDHAYLSRMINGKAHVNANHIRRISKHLGLPDDYFPEVREAAVVDAIRAHPRLRDNIYADHVKRRKR